MGWLDSITDLMDMNLSNFQEPGVLRSMGSQRARHDQVAEQHGNRTVGYNTDNQVFGPGPAPSQPGLINPLNLEPCVTKIGTDTSSGPSRPLFLPSLISTGFIQIIPRAS